MAADHRARHFGVLSFTGTGHVNPLISLSRELQARGHKVTFFEKPKIANRVRNAGLGFVPIEYEKYPPRAPRPIQANPGLWNEVSTLRFNLKRVSRDIEMFLRNTPDILVHSGVDALIINELALTGPTMAELLRLPYFLFSVSVPHNFGWNPSPLRPSINNPRSWVGNVERMLLDLSVMRIRGPIRGIIDRYRQRHGLAPVREMQSIYPCLAHVTQLPEFLDLPRHSLPANFHYTGPFISNSARPPVEFPWHRLDERPLIYASLGTTRNIQPSIFRMIAEACCDLDAQLLISLGGRFEPETMADLPGSPLIVRYAPQLEILKRAALVITHAGPNSILETLMEGVPMIAIPLAHDQPAIAARLARLKLAEVFPLNNISSEKIRATVVKLLSDSRYHDSAQQIAARVRSLHGAERAADIIEASLAQIEGVSPGVILDHAETYASVAS